MKSAKTQQTDHIIVGCDLHDENMLLKIAGMGYREGRPSSDYDRGGNSPTVPGFPNPSLLNVSCSTTSVARWFR